MSHRSDSPLSPKEVDNILVNLSYSQGLGFRGEGRAAAMCLAELEPPGSSQESLFFQGCPPLVPGPSCSHFFPQYSPLLLSLSSSWSQFSPLSAMRSLILPSEQSLTPLDVLADASQCGQFSGAEGGQTEGLPCVERGHVGHCLQPSRNSMAFPSPRWEN